MVHDTKLEGKRKVQAIALSIVLAVLLFASKYIERSRNDTPRNISEIRVGQQIYWEESVMNCTLTVYNIQSVVPPSNTNTDIIEFEEVCGSLKCTPNSAIVHGDQEFKYACYTMRQIKTLMTD